MAFDNVTKHTQKGKTAKGLPIPGENIKSTIKVKAHKRGFPGAHVGVTPPKNFAGSADEPESLTSGDGEASDTTEETPEQEQQEEQGEADCPCGDPGCPGCIVGAMKSPAAMSKLQSGFKKSYAKAHG